MQTTLPASGGPGGGGGPSGPVFSTSVFGTSLIGGTAVKRGTLVGNVPPVAQSSIVALTPDQDTADVTVDLTTASSLPSALSLVSPAGLYYWNASGVHVTAAANTPRFEYSYNGLSWVQEGLLVECVAQTNYFLQSNTFSNASWTKTNTALTSGQSSPDGGTNAWKLDETAVTGVFSLSQTLASGALPTNNTTYLTSFLVQAAERSVVFIRVDDNINGAAGIYFDLSAGTVGSAIGSVTGLIVDRSNGWYEIAAARTDRDGLGSTDYLIVCASDTGALPASRAGTAGNGIYVYTAQLEYPLFSAGGATGKRSSYIPTTTAAVARGVDTLKVAGALDTIITAGPFSMIMEFKLQKFMGSGAFFASSAASDDGIYANGNANNQVLWVTFGQGGSGAATLGAGGTNAGVLTNATGVVARIGFATNQAHNNQFGFGDSALVADDGVVTAPSFGFAANMATGAYIFRNRGAAGGASDQFMSGYLRKIFAYKGRISNDLLQSQTDTSVTVVVNNYNLDASPGAFAETGFAASMDLQEPASSGAFSVTANTAVNAVKMPAGSGSFSLIGFAAGDAVNEPAASGTFALTGFSAGLKIAEPLGSGSFSLIGFSASEAVGEPAASGTFVLTGFATGEATSMPAGSGTFVETGFAATLIHIGKLPANSGTFALTGGAAGLGVGEPLVSGSFSLIGFAAGEAVGEPAASGAFALTGFSAGNAVNMPAGSGSFVLTGGAAAFTVVHRMPLGSGTFVLTGGAAGLAIAAPIQSGSFSLIGFSSVEAINEAAASGAFVLTGYSATFNPLTFDFTALAALPADLSISQSGSTTYFNSSGVLTTASANSPRFAFRYTGTSWVAEGLLLEAYPATNLFLQSNSFSTTPWVTDNTALVSGAATSPDGTSNAWKINETATTGLFDLHQPFTFSKNNSPGTVSFILKAGERSWAFVKNRDEWDGTEGGAYFNLSTGTKGSIVGANTTSRMTNVGGGYYICEVCKSDQYSISCSGWLYICTSDTGAHPASRAGTASNGIYVCFSQAEDGLVRTSYIPTTTATVARARDILSSVASSQLDTMVKASGFSMVVGTKLLPLPVQGPPGMLVSDQADEDEIAIASATTATFNRWGTGITGTATLGGGSYVDAIAMTGLTYTSSQGSLVANAGSVITPSQSFFNGFNNGITLFYAAAAGSPIGMNGFLRFLKVWTPQIADAALVLETTLPSTYTLSANSGTFVLTGNAASLKLSEPAGSGTFALTGFAAGNAVGLPASSGSFALTGNAAALIHIGKLAAGSGTFSYTGNPAGFSINEPGASGTFVLTGFAAGIAIGEPAGSGSFSLIGFAAGEAVKEPAGSGAFALTGFAASDAIGMPAGAATFAYTGGAASLFRTGKLAAASGTFSLSGGAAGLAASAPLSSGTFSVTGRATTQAINLPAASGTFSLTGNAAILAHGHSLMADSAAFTITGGATSQSVGLPAGSGSFSLIGFAAGDAINEPAASGPYTLTGRAAGFAIAVPLTSGAFALTGGAATFALAGSGSASDTVTSSSTIAGRKAVSVSLSHSTVPSGTFGTLAKATHSAPAATATLSAVEVGVHGTSRTLSASTSQGSSEASRKGGVSTITDTVTAAGTLAKDAAGSSSHTTTSSGAASGIKGAVRTLTVTIVSGASVPQPTKQGLRLVTDTVASSSSETSSKAARAAVTGSVASGSQPVAWHKADSGTISATIASSYQITAFKVNNAVANISHSTASSGSAAIRKQAAIAATATVVSTSSVVWSRNAHFDASGAVRSASSTVFIHGGLVAIIGQQFSDDTLGWTKHIGIAVSSSLAESSTLVGALHLNLDATIETDWTGGATFTANDNIDIVQGEWTPQTVVGGRDDLYVIEGEWEPPRTIVGT